MEIDRSFPADWWNRPNMSFLIGGRYEVTDKLGDGAFGEVWRARDRESAAQVAVKFATSPTAQVTASAIREAFDKEERALRQIVNSNVVSFLDSGMHDGRRFMVLEFVPGKSLWDIFQSQRVKPTMGAGEKISILLNVARALNEVHTSGFVYLDLKPENILVTPQGRAVLIDFGSSLTLQEARSKAAEVETTAYCAPEQIQGCRWCTSAGLTAKTDVFAFGIVAWEILSLKRPFGDAEVGYRHRIANDNPEGDLLKLSPDCPAELVSLLRICLSKNPAGRPSMSSVAQRIETINALLASHTLYREGHLEEAIQKVEEAIAASPELQEARDLAFEFAKEYIDVLEKDGQEEKARECVQRARDHCFANPERVKQLDKLEREIGTRIRLNARIHALVDQAKRDEEKGDTQAARENIDMAEKLYPAHPVLQGYYRSRYAQVEHFLRVSDYQGAIACWKSLSEDARLNQSFSGAAAELDRLWRKIWKQAGSDVEDASFNQDFAGALNLVERLGSSWREDEQTQVQIQRLAAIVSEQKSAYVDSVHHHSLKLASGGRYEEALVIVGRALEVMPDNATLLSTRTDLEGKADEAGDALRAIRREIDAGALDRASALIEQGRNSRTVGDDQLDELEAIVRRETEISSSVSRVQELISEGRLDDAAVLADELREAYPADLRVIRTKSELDTKLHERARDEMVAEIEQLFDIGDLDAIALKLDVANLQFPRDRRIETLNRRLEDARPEPGDEFRGEEEFSSDSATQPSDSPYPELNPLPAEPGPFLVEPSETLEPWPAEIVSSPAEPVSPVTPTDVAEWARKPQPPPRSEPPFGGRSPVARKPTESPRAKSKPAKASAREALAKKSRANIWSDPMYLGGAAILLLIMVVGASLWKSHKPSPNQPSKSAPEATLVVQTPGVQGATVLVDDKPYPVSGSELRIPGTTDRSYHIQVTKDGYEPSQPQSLTLGLGAGPLVVTLVPRADSATLVLSQSTPNAAVVIDGKKAGTVDSGGSFQTQVTAGQHTILVASGGRSSDPLSQVFKAHGRVELSPTVPPPPENPAMLVLGASTPNADVMIDGIDSGAVRGDGSFDTQVAPGAHKIMLTMDGRNSPEVSQPFNQQETVHLSLTVPPAPLPPPTLVLSGSTVNADVLIDSNRIGTVSSSGSFQTTQVPPGQHTIQLASGGQTSDQVSRPFAAGSTVALSLTVHQPPPPPPPADATLVLSGSTVNAGVVIDGKSSGTVGADGSFQTTVPPGQHTVLLASSGGQTSDRRTLEFKAGEKVPLTLTVHQPQVVVVPQPKPTPPPPPPPAVSCDAVQELTGPNELNAFRNQHPVCADKVQARLDALDQQKWDSVKNGNEAQLQSYLTEFPQGKFADAARAKIRDLRKTTDPVGVQLALDKYCQAFDSRDMNQLRSAWPSIRGDAANADQQTFTAVKAMKLTLQQCSKKISGDNAAEADCQQTVTFTLKDQTNPITKHSPVTFDLTRSSTGWVIENVR